MKHGLIIYLVGSETLPEDINAVAAARALGEAADAVELVSPQEGFFTVEDAWHFLFTRGCGRINLLVALAEAEVPWRPLGPKVRLCG